MSDLQNIVDTLDKWGAVNVHYNKAIDTVGGYYLDESDKDNPFIEVVLRCSSGLQIYQNRFVFDVYCAFANKYLISVVENYSSCSIEDNRISLKFGSTLLVLVPSRN